MRRRSLLILRRSKAGPARFIVRKVMAQAFRFRFDRTDGWAIALSAQTRTRACDRTHPVKGLFTNRSRAMKAAGASRPQCEGEHAVQVLDHVGAVFFLKMRQDFGV